MNIVIISVVSCCLILANSKNILYFTSLYQYCSHCLFVMFRLPSLPVSSVDDLEDCHIEEDNDTEGTTLIIVILVKISLLFIAVLSQRPICEECEKVNGDLKCVKCECIFCQPCFDMVSQSQL